MTLTVKSCGFEATDSAILQSLGNYEAVPSLTADMLPQDFGLEQALFLNGQSPTYALSSLSQVSSTLPLSTAAYIAGNDAISQMGFLRLCQLTAFSSPLSTLPASFPQILANFIGVPFASSKLANIVPSGQAKSMTFNQADMWKLYVQKMTDFLSKFQIVPENVSSFLGKLEMMVMNNPAGFDYFMDKEVFMGSVVVPLDFPESKVMNEIFQTYEGAPPGGSDGTPANIVHHALKSTHFVFVRKVEKGVQLSFAYFLKKAPPFTGYAVRFDKNPPAKQAFDTFDPTTLANSLKSTGEVASDSSISIAAAAPPPTNDEMVQLKNQMKQFEILNSIYIHANKILGEEIKRLVRQRKEPTTDQELKFARNQLEVKIKKLLVRLTQYDATLRETTQQMENIKDQLAKAMEEKKVYSEKINSLEEELIQARTGT